jgi:hypothetical protein
LNGGSRAYTVPCVEEANSRVAAFIHAPPQKEEKNMTESKMIKASLRLSKTAPIDVVARADAVCGGIFTANEDYPHPPVDKPTLQGQIDRLSASITTALDGGRKAIAERNRQQKVLARSLHQLANYVEHNCKDDMTTFLKSGFQAVTTIRTKVQPLSESIRKIVPGNNSGQMLVTIVALAAALSYELRRATAAPGGTPGTWISQPVGNTKPPTLVTGLTPGTTYVFQVRAVTNSGYTDWSESVTRICT